MKRIITYSILLLIFVACVWWGIVLWSERPWRVVARVNDRTLTVQELSLRVSAMQQDYAANTNTNEISSKIYYRVAQLWVIKEVLLSEALACGYKVTPADELEVLSRMTERLKSRHLTPELFFMQGILPEELKKQDFQEGVLIYKLVTQAVREKIKISQRDIDERLDFFRQQQKQEYSRKQVYELILREKYRLAFAQLVRMAYAKCVVKSPDYPQIEQINQLVKE